jgi:allantoin racemase
MGHHIRICKIIPVARGLENWGALHEELLAEIASDDVEVLQVDLPEVGITSIGTREDVDLVAPAHLRAALRAEANGFDAVVMGCLMEPGVAAARQALRIPVAGDAGATIHLASLVARRFSFLIPGVGTDGGIEVVEDIVRGYGFTDHVASIRGVAASSLDFARGGEQALADEMLQAARAAIEEDGAQAIIGYGGLPIFRALRQQLVVPVISPIQASVIVAEMLVRAGLSNFGFRISDF